MARYLVVARCRSFHVNIMLLNGCTLMSHHQMLSLGSVTLSRAGPQSIPGSLVHESFDVPGMSQGPAQLNPAVWQPTGPVIPTLIGIWRVMRASLKACTASVCVCGHCIRKASSIMRSHRLKLSGTYYVVNGGVLVCHKASRPPGRRLCFKAHDAAAGHCCEGLTLCPSPRSDL
jgi:hypothetical protein